MVTLQPEQHHLPHPIPHVPTLPSPF
ncbi:hypothetical protein LCER1_G000386 [Lachnellula cervina]|uniref:Uncharacterized protein n=1 Tax=Lachnellula cervina TaxID=1316786 RepID=A0A7D8UXQ1_9HELO|nr:hypothetical protein LCER1_G000386 [Lachnellula cervina]